MRMKRTAIVLVIVFLISSARVALAAEDSTYVLAGRFVAKSEEYIFCIEETAESINQLNRIEYMGNSSCILVSVSAEKFDELFEMNEKITLMVDDANSDGIYEVAHSEGRYHYLIWDKMEENPAEYVSGYFEEESYKIAFHDEFFKEPNVYKFNIVSTESEYPEYNDYVYLVYEKEYFDNKFSPDKGYSFYIFNTGEKFEGRDLYTMLYAVDMKYFDSFKFKEYDKSELQEQEEEKKKEELERTFVPMIAVIGAIVVTGVALAVYSKIKKNK